jgi:photosystem II stability/assembly factor-like uncharacterized protein
MIRLLISHIALLVATMAVHESAHAQSTWRPLTDTRSYRGVWMASATEGWAVGDAGLISRTTDGGTTWTDADSGTTRQLNAVWGNGASSVWTVGNGGVILRWNGTTWAAQDSGVTVDLMAIHGVDATNVYAAGESTTILKYDGTTWTDEGTPGAQNVLLRGVFAADASNIWVVGNGGRTIKGDGTSWANQTPGTTNDLHAIWGTSASNLIAVGEAGTVRISTNGNTWAAGPVSGLTTLLRGVRGTGTNSIWITGDDGEIRFYNGSGPFVAQDSDLAVNVNSIFAVNTNKVVAVGGNRGRTVFNGTAWTGATSGFPTNNYNAVWASDDDSVWFVGNNGRASRWDGSTFTAGPNTGVGGNALNDVWGWDNEQVWAVGNGGAITKWNGTEWGPQVSGTTQTLNGVYGSSPSDVWAVGDGGTILRFDGTSWSARVSPTTRNINAVWAASPTAAWAVAEGGVILRWNGTSWSSQASGTTRDLNDLQGAASNAIWAVGASGTILRYNGTAWATEKITGTPNLTAIAVVNSTNVWASGGTTILRRNGSTWATDGTTDFTNGILGAWATSVSTVFLGAQTGMAFTNAPVNFPQVSVKVGAGTELVSNRSTVNFGDVILPASNTLTFSVANLGTSLLSGLTVTKQGAHAANFTVEQVGISALPPSSNFFFDVTFAPSADGVRTAELRIASNDPDESVVVIPLTGRGQVPVSITTQPVSKTTNPGTKVVLSVSATGTLPLVYTWQKWNPALLQFESLGAPSLPTLTLNNVTEANEGDYRVVVNNLPISTRDSNIVTLTVNDAISFTSPPSASTVAVGSPVSLITSVTGSDPKKYQWRRNNVNLRAPLGTAPSYDIASAQLANAGEYTVLVSNVVNSQTSTPAASLTVVDTQTKVLKLPAATRATITAPFAGKAASFTWKRNGGPLPPDPRYTFVKNVLTITNLQVSPTNDSDTYTCEITGMDGVTKTARTDLVVYTDRPIIVGADPIVMDDAMVGDPTYSFAIPVDPDPLFSPTKFAASPLPTGLVCNSITGVISGRPAVAITSDRLYNVTFTVSNARGSVTKKATLLLKPMAPGSLGTFTGPIARSALNTGLGGKFDLTSSSAGSFTGKVTLGATAHSFSGKWTTDLSGGNAPTAMVTILRKSPLPPLNVSFKSDAASHVLTLGLVDDGLAPASFTAWKKRWGTALSVAEKANLDTYRGYYTFGMEAPVPVVSPPTTPSEVHPQGISYGAFTVGSTGSLTIAGRTADHTAYTAATFCGPDGQVLLFKTLYSNKGSLLGTLDIDQGTAAFVPPYGDNTLSGTVSWNRPVTTTTVYRSGFGPIDLNAVGGRYVPPPAGTLLFGVTDDGVTNNSKLLFTAGGINGTSTDMVGTISSPDAALRIKSTGGVALPSPNARSLTLTYSKTTGIFSGKFSLLDVNPAVPGTNITRTPLYYGIIHRQSSGDSLGQGYYLLRRRPDAASSQTITTTDQLSGKVIFQKSP